MSEGLSDDDPAWVKGCRRDEVIRRLLHRCSDRLTVGSVEDAPEFWAETFVGPMMPSCGADMLECIWSLVSAAPWGATVKPPKFSNLRQY